MHRRTWLACAFVPVLTFAALAAQSAATMPPPPAAPAPPSPPAPPAAPLDVRSLSGVWVFAEDRTEGRPLEEHGPNMGPKVTLRVDDDAVYLVRSRGEIRVALDGSPTEVIMGESKSIYRGQWTDGAFEYSSEPENPAGGGRPIRWTMRPTTDVKGGGTGLLITVAVGGGPGTTCLFRHPDDIAPPEPAKAVIADMDWLAGAWVGKRGTGGATSIEERWSPPLGGAMLAIARTVSRDRMRAFEFLRIVEKDGGLVYAAQPNGAPKTEYVLTQLTPGRAVFDNPRHDSPQRIVYELSPEGRLSASIGFITGGRLQRFDFERESTPPPSTPAAETTPKP